MGTNDLQIVDDDHVDTEVTFISFGLGFYLVDSGGGRVINEDGVGGDVIYASGDLGHIFWGQVTVEAVAVVKFHMSADRAHHDFWGRHFE